MDCESNASQISLVFLRLFISYVLLILATTFIQWVDQEKCDCFSVGFRGEGAFHVQPTKLSECNDFSHVCPSFCSQGGPMWLLSRMHWTSLYRPCTENRPCAGEKRQRQGRVQCFEYFKKHHANVCMKWQ